MPTITLPDGSQRAFDRPVTVHEVAANIGAGLAKAALAGKVNGRLVDTSYLIERDASLAIVTERDAEGLDAIEKRMQELAAADQQVTRTLMSREEAMQLFAGMGEEYKRRIIEDIPRGEPLSFYKQGEFLALCRGPHVPSTGKMKAFKMKNVDGAYWRGTS